MYDNFEKLMNLVDNNLPSYQYFVVGCDKISRTPILEIPISEYEYQALQFYIAPNSSNLSKEKSTEIFQLDITSMHAAFEKFYNESSFGQRNSILQNANFEWYLEKVMR